MARVFNGSNQYLARSAVATAVPLSFSAWINSTDTGAANRGILSLVDGGTYNGFYVFVVRENHPSNPGVVFATTRQGTSLPNAQTSGSITDGAWHHVAAVFASSSSRAIYLDYSDKGTESTSVTPTGVDETNIGRITSAGSEYWNGKIAYAAIWNVALTDANVLDLQTRHPRMVRPDKLVACWDLGGFQGENDLDHIGGYDMTAYNSPTWSESPPIIYPRRPTIFLASSAAAPASSLLPLLHNTKRGNKLGIWSGKA